MAAKYYTANSQPKQQPYLGTYTDRTGYASLNAINQYLTKIFMTKNNEFDL
jgi:hypothetical protein